jgi:hypothetical protein
LPSKTTLKNAAIFTLSVMAVMGAAPIIMAFADRLTGGAAGSAWNAVFGGLASATGTAATAEVGATDAGLSD